MVVSLRELLGDVADDNRGAKDAIERWAFGDDDEPGLMDRIEEVLSPDRPFPGWRTLLRLELEGTLD